MAENRRVVRRRARRLLVPVVAMATMAGGFVGVTASPASAGVTVGYACGYWANVSLFGSPYETQGCAPQTDDQATANTLSPSVTLPPGGALQSATDNSGAMSQYGPAIFFSSPYDVNDNLTNSGQLKVTTGGTTTINSTARAAAVGPSPFWTQTPTSAPPYGEPARSAYYDGTEGFVRATCSATSPTSKSGSVTIKNGRVDTHIGADGYPTETVVVPSPTPINHRVDFWLENISAEEHGHMVFNERIQNPDGSITVNAAHMYMEGPIAFGEVIIGQVKCGHA